MPVCCVECIVPKKKKRTVPKCQSKRCKIYFWIQTIGNRFLNLDCYCYSEIVLQWSIMTKKPKKQTNKIKLILIADNIEWPISSTDTHSDDSKSMLIFCDAIFTGNPGTSIIHIRRLKERLLSHTRTSFIQYLYVQNNHMSIAATHISFSLLLPKYYHSLPLASPLTLSLPCHLSQTRTNRRNVPCCTAIFPFMKPSSDNPCTLPPLFSSRT